MSVANAKIILCWTEVMKQDARQRAKRYSSLC
jgi:hypothetical protein